MRGFSFLAQLRKYAPIGLLAFAAIPFLVWSISPRAQQADPTRLYLPGVNLSGAEFFTVFRADGTRSQHGSTREYLYPSKVFAPRYRSDYFLEKGMKAFRLPFLWERIQPKLDNDLDTKELYLLKTTVDELIAKGAWVILDVHNYARYYDQLIGSDKVSIAQFADLWRRLTKQFKSYSHVMFGLMNEPYDMSNEVWLRAANAAIAAIRQEGSTNYLLIGGNHYSSARSWYDALPGGSNAKTMLQIQDPLKQVIFEAHAYLDSNAGGQKETCVSPMIGVERVEPFTKWLRENQLKGFLGEFGAGTEETCLEALANLTKYLAENRDVYVGWAYWSAGPKWPLNWMYLLEPKNGKDAPQMRAMLPYIAQ